MRSVFASLSIMFAIIFFSCTSWAAPKESVLYSFQGGVNDGGLPVGGLVADAKGNLYGTTGSGGGFGNCSPFGQTCGVVFELTPGASGSWSESVIYTFTGREDGGEPLAGLTIDSEGNLYGTTTIGGSFDLGTVFMLTPSGASWTETVIYSFEGGSDGEYPQSAVTLRNGAIYGMTYAGGGNSCISAPSGCGTIFELTKGQNGWAEQVLYRFANGSDGAFPYASLVVDPFGNLYGATTQGGYLQGNCAPYGCGNVFQLLHSGSSWALNTLYAFTGTNDGSAPYGGLLFDKFGNMYGTASGGGAQFDGTVFELKYKGKSAWSYEVLYTFSGSDGQAPESSLVSFGNRLFGTTHSGGTGSGCLFGSTCGTVFMLTETASGWKETVLHSFTSNNIDGVYPESAVTLGKNVLYGTTNAGGNKDQGTIFTITP